MIACLLFAQIAAAPAPVRFDLPNGLRVWVQEDHSRPVALVQVTYKVGSVNEGPGMTGIAHYVEHMVYRATENIRNEDVYGYIDRIGGRYTGGTWPDVTRYAETVPRWALESALRVTAERVTRALFDSLEFERERSNVVTEANGFSETDPRSTLRDAIMYVSFELHPYRYSSNTWVRDNLVLTRAEAYDWYTRHYGPNNAVLVIVGDVATSDVRRLVERHFIGLPRAPGTGEIKLIEPPQVVEKRVTLRYASKRALLEIVYRAPQAAHPDYPALVALDGLLRPRLARVARDARAEIVTKDTATSYPFVYRISVSADSGANLESILAAIDSEIALVARGGFAGDLAGDLAAARGDERSRTPEVQTQSASGPPRQSKLTRMADKLAERETFSWEIGSALLEKVRGAAARATASDIQAYVKAWMNPSQRTVGVLIPGGDGPLPRRIDVPPLTTPPAKRMRPEPVPARALEPLVPLSIETGRRVLPNGITVRAARVLGDSVTLRVLVDYGHTSDTLVRRFSARDTDAAMTAAVVGVRSMYSTRPKPPPVADSGVDAHTRARVLAGITPVLAVNASMSAAVSVSVAGPQAVDEQLRSLAARFQSLPSNRAPRRYQAPFGTVGVRQERIPAAGETQVSIVAGLPGVPRGHPDRRALELLNYVVGVPWYGGRLGWALTKTGLAYSSAATTTFGSETGYVLFTTQCDTRNTESTIQAISEVIAGVGVRGVEEWELREAQAFTLGRTLLYGAREGSSRDAIAAALGDSESAGLELLDLPALSRAYLSVTLADINRVARTYYRADMLKIVAIGAVPSGEPERIFPEGTFRALFEP